MFEQNWLHSIIWNVSELLLRDDVHRVVFQKSEENYTEICSWQILAWREKLDLARAQPNLILQQLLFEKWMMSEQDSYCINWHWLVLTPQHHSRY